MKTLKVAAAIALSAALLYLGTGLHPIPWLTWLAPLPVFLLAPRVGAGTALAAAFTAWLAGQTAMWAYFLNVLQMPLPAAALVQLVPALVFGLAVVAARALTLRGHLLSGVVIVPSCWVTMEYAMSVVLPHGAWASLAYTQTDVLPILQTASVTGVWGITFLLMAVPSALAALLTPASLVRRTPLAGAPLSRAIALNPGQVRMAVIFGSVVIAALGYGGWQLRATPQPRPDKVALVATDHPDDVVSLSTPQGHDLVDHYVTSIDKLAKDGARVVVLPEKTFLADDKSLPTLARPLTRIARTHHVDVVAGLVLSKAGAS
ncbi:MAG TPA: hypothetical protein VM093_00700, partial [Aeromicrobium sp.]|nr:hypothetical protein [Aeromicrobium sp.]